MANRIYLDDYTGQDTYLPNSWPILDDISIEAKSQFGSFAESIPMAEEGLSFGVAVQTATTGQVSKSLLEFKNTFDIPRWKKTDPVVVQTKLIFPLKDKPELDIYEPIQNLVGYSILTKNDKGGYSVPGISLASMKAFQNRKTGDKVLVSNAKLVSVWIPGVIYLPIAIIESAQPLYSKEVTESGFPLWGELQLQIRGIFPANTDMFKDAKISSRIKAGDFGRLTGIDITGI